MESVAMEQPIMQVATDTSGGLLIDNGHLIDPSQSLNRVGRLLVLGDRVAGMDVADGDLPQRLHRIDATGRLVTPGLVDLCAELREPGSEQDETIQTGSDAALAGGYTSILCSSSTKPVIDSPAEVQFVHQKASRNGGVRVYVIACLSKNRASDQMAELGLLADAGAAAFSDAPKAMPNDALLKRALDYCRML
ncbi:MAG: dihydroorotase, partial [Planctomycetota bacterium]